MDILLGNFLENSRTSSLETCADTERVNGRNMICIAKVYLGPCQTYMLTVLAKVFDIQFHWQFLIIYSNFWLINTLLRKFHTSSEKEMKMIKNTNFLMRKKKWKKMPQKYRLTYSNILYSELAPLTRDVTCSKLKYVSKWDNHPSYRLLVQIETLEKGVKYLQC